MAENQPLQARLPVLPRWPVTIAAGPVELRPMRRRDRVVWEAIRARNRAWHGPWDATPPAGHGGDVPANFNAMIRSFDQAARGGTILPWFVWFAPDWPASSADVLAGQLTVSGIAYGSARWGQVGYWVDERWAGRGIIPTAVALASDYCFQVLGLHRIEIAIRPENAKSLGVVEKLGFRHEGRRARYLHIDGDWRDHEMFALHAEEIGESGLLGRLPAPRTGA